jgi:hypothetical protein
VNFEHSMQPIIDEMFKNGPEEGCRIWEDSNHPLHQAIVILLRARLECQIKEATKEATVMLEHHRYQEEESTYGL